MQHCDCRIVFAVALFAASALASLESADAALRVCNPSPAPTLVAIGHAAQESWVSQGWWQVAPKQCSTVLAGALDHRFYYIYAWRSDGIHWGSRSNQDGGWFCLSMKPFKVGDVDCEAQGFRSVQFREVDTGSADTFTVQIGSSGS